MYIALQNSWLPPDTVSEGLYKECRDKSKLTISISMEEAALIGFVGVGCSYAGKWFGGYARSVDSKGLPRNHCLEQKKAVVKQLQNIKNVNFFNMEYTNLPLPKNSTVYCDPPYEGVSGYKDKFDTDKFWQWVRMESVDKDVYVSEYNAPNDFECLWSKEVMNNFDVQLTKKKAVEKLFKYKG